MGRASGKTIFNHYYFKKNVTLTLYTIPCHGATTTK